MKAFGRFGITVAVFVVSLNLGCSDARNGGETSSSGCSPAQPVWTILDTELVKVGKADPNALIKRTKATLHLRPPFYSGGGDLSFKELSHEAEPGLCGSMGGHCGLVLAQDFGEFKNLFVYPDSPEERLSGMPKGARTTGPGGELLAEAKVVAVARDANNQLQGIDIQEFHYGPGGCFLFQSKSRIAPRYSWGFKVSESEVSGRKKADYYFLWPMELE
jgi:hypothetical protein